MLTPRTLAARILRPQIALFHRFRSGPWGGSNQFFVALRNEFRRRNLRVGANLVGPSTRACLLNSFAFDEAVLRGSPRSTDCRIVHRVDGPVGTYRGTGPEPDLDVARRNRAYAHATVFQSRYCLEAHRSMGIALVNPVVILNSVDPEIFHTKGRVAWNGERPLRLITSSWSDNPNKGAQTLQLLAKSLDRRRFQLTFVGRSPIPIDGTRMIKPVPSRALARILRQHDIFVAPSRHDPCSNALLEALACGLPAVYLASGGHPEIVKDAGVAYEHPEAASAAVERLAEHYHDYQRAIRISSLSEVADEYLRVMGIQA